jgi:predicted glycosyltransferase
VRTRIGFYVHHQGRGHLSRAQALLPHLESEALIFTSLDTRGLDQTTEIVSLPLDTDAPSYDAGDVSTPRIMHYAPLGSSGLASRMAALATAIATSRIDLLVVDVSVEVTLLARLCGAPVVVVRQHGNRFDLPHIGAFDCAVSLLAPYAREMEGPSTPEWVRRKTFYSGGFSRHDGRLMTRSEARSAVEFGAGERSVVVIAGAGGRGVELDDVGAAARETRDYSWTVVGRARGRTPEVRNIGWIEDPFPYIVAADIVVGAAGDGVVSDVASVRRRFVTIPEERPFGEQFSTAQGLSGLGLAVLKRGWAPSEEWPSVLRAAGHIDTKEWSRLFDGNGARRAADHLDRMARRFSSSRRS